MSDLIMVAMSGGVDSSTVAWLLKQQGKPIAGMFMKNWEEEDTVSGCSAEDDAADARRVAEILGIDFHGRNFAAEYWDEVFEQFLAELRAGRTPNPDILCNREIKFRTFVEHARDLGAAHIATGHYARRRDNDDGTVSLLKGIDSNKDQSYFLYALDQEQLQHALFPLGELTKPEVRDLAAQADLPVAAKKDSTGICFIGERNFDRFIANYLDAEPGEIRTSDGTVIGTHQGLIHYTLGQRKGLNIGGLKDFPEAPWYVTYKDIEHNVLYAEQQTDHPTLMSTSLEASDLNWIRRQPEAGERLHAKVRYRQPDQACRVEAIDQARLQLVFDKPQRAVTPGQAVVLYHGDECLGGGTITTGNAPLPDQLTNAKTQEAIHS
ncbi:tRNA 2-thiouridine(34) synthase MnmA [Wenzhouxiangella sp. XN201]|uniref:tRNA 2-thiouridine(34) synthase MnmA n=1 Tax=Wenzhouxiangella sp. XN201 TaxID=2710755 RepID=UPI0013CD16AB|nr:tRNA 2-thiouridine(34) synthase MnmA [Wenzhouxiangella sp. XN201]NEZ03754.1 tRNA 2-thiouridine(34) synthase MnmA [Wenzhouxiangella sp. XN201]